MPPTPPTPPTPPKRHGAFARGLLFAHLLLSPLVFSKDTVEVFEYNKVAALLVAALALAAYGLGRLVYKRATLPAAEATWDALVVQPALAVVRDPWRDPVGFGFFLFFASALASTVTSLSVRTSILGCHESFAGIFTILGYTILFFSTRAFVHTAGDARRLLTASVIGAAVSSAYAIVQATHKDPIVWGRTSGYNEYIRPFATLGHPNFLSAFLVMAVPICAYFAYRAASRRSWMACLVSLLILHLATIGVALSISRGAWFAYAAAVDAFVLICAGLRQPRAALVAAGLHVATLGAAVGLWYWKAHGNPPLEPFGPWIKVAAVVDVLALLFAAARAWREALAILLPAIEAVTLVGAIMGLTAAGVRFDPPPGDAPIAANAPLLDASIENLANLAAHVTPSGRTIIISMKDRVRGLTEHASREEIWAAAVRMWLYNDPIKETISPKSFLFGCGLDAFQLAFEQQRTTDYWKIEWNGTPTKAHNEALHILATQGAFGFAAVLVMTAGIGICLLRAWRVSTLANRMLLAAIAAGVVAFYVQDVFSFTVAGCGTLYVTFAALASRLGRVAEGAQPAASPEEDERLTAPSDSTGIYAIAIVIGDLVAMKTLFFNIGDDTMGGMSNPEIRKWRGVVGLALLLAYAIPSFVAWYFELEDEAEHEGPPATPHASARRRIDDDPAFNGDVLLVQGAIWAIAIALMYTCVYIPYKSNSLCREGNAEMSHDPAKGVEILERATALDPTKELGFVKLGTVAQFAAKYATDGAKRREYLQIAEDAFRRAIELIPENSYNHANMGRLLGEMAAEEPDRDKRMRLAAGAFKAFRDALELDQNNAYFWSDAANAAMRLGDYNAAKAYAEQGAKLYDYEGPPGSPERNRSYGPFHYQLGEIARIQGRLDEAVKLLSEATTMDWKGDTAGLSMCYTSLELALFALQRIPEAEAAAAHAIELYQRNVDARMTLAKCLILEKKVEEAKRQLELILKIQPDNAEAKKLLEKLGGP